MITISALAASTLGQFTDFIDFYAGRQLWMKKDGKKRSIYNKPEAWQEPACGSRLYLVIDVARGESCSFHRTHPRDSHTPDGHSVEYISTADESRLRAIAVNCLFSQKQLRKRMYLQANRYSVTRKILYDLSTDAILMNVHELAYRMCCALAHSNEHKQWTLFPKLNGFHSDTFRYLLNTDQSVRCSPYVYQLNNLLFWSKGKIEKMPTETVL